MSDVDSTPEVVDRTGIKLLHEGDLISVRVQRP